MSGVSEQPLPAGSSCRIARTVWSFIAHPAAFFGARLQRGPGWALSVSAPAVCAALQFVSALLFSEKTLPVVREFLIKQNLQVIDMRPFDVAASVVAGVSYLIAYAMTIVAVVCLDVLLKDSGKLPRLAEFTGLSFFSQVPYCAFMVIAACIWSPGSVSLPAGASASEIRVAVQEWRETMFSWPLLATMRAISYYSLIWQVALIVIFLKVVSRLSGRATLLAGVILLALFVLFQVIESYR